MKFFEGDGDYGFIDSLNMPRGKFLERNIDSISELDWATTRETNDIANNHCGATCATNLALYFANGGYPELKLGNRRDTFRAVHKIIGNGPVVFLTRGAKKYFRIRGLDLCSAHVYSYQELKIAVDNNQPMALLLADGLFNWHWVLAVGYREYENGQIYIRIVNSWDNTIEKFYQVNRGSFLAAVTRYWIEDE